MMEPQKNIASYGQTIHISFTLMDDTTYGSQKKFVKDNMSEFFPHSKLTYEAPEGLVDREIVYSFSCPSIADDDSYHDFFNKLKSLLEATARFLPNFTQSPEANS